jgi:hypothetical protein
MDDYHVFSTDDLVTWTDHGVILSSTDLAWGRPVVTGVKGFMWAPDCAFKNDKYYYYFPHLPGDGDWSIGVAISDSPTSGFKDKGTPLLTGSFMYDPCVFVDDDGSAYLYVGGGSRNDRCKGVQLNDDMVSLKGELQTMEGLEDFHEGTWVFKRKGVYYLTYPDNHDQGGNQMRWAVSSKPLGPWTYKGVFFGPCDSGTSHGSIVEFKGDWYLFYHNQALSGMGNLRSVCVNHLEFEENGDIVYQEPDKSPVQKAEGKPAGGKEFLAGDYCTPGGTAMFESHGSIEALAGFHLDGSFGTFKGINAGAGQKQLYLRYASNDSGSFVTITVNGEKADTILAHGNGGWDDFSAYAHTVIELKAGDNEIVLGGGYGGINIASIILI